LRNGGCDSIAAGPFTSDEIKRGRQKRRRRHSSENFNEIGAFSRIINGVEMKKEEVDLYFNSVLYVKYSSHALMKREKSLNCIFFQKKFQCFLSAFERNLPFLSEKILLKVYVGEEI